MIPRFRAWHKKEKKMILKIDQLLTDSKGRIVAVVGTLDKKVCDAWDVPEQAILMQSTGLKDKSRKEIFENDVFVAVIEGKKHWYVIKRGQFRWEAAEDNKWIVGLYDVYTAVLDLEVIGNIHGNPELLKEAQT